MIGQLAEETLWDTNRQASRFRYDVFDQINKDEEKGRSHFSSYWKKLEPPWTVSFSRRSEEGRAGLIDANHVTQTNSKIFLRCKIS